MPHYKAVLLDAYNTIMPEGGATPAGILHELLTELGFGIPLERIREANDETFRLFLPRLEAFETSGRASSLSDIYAFFEEYDLELFERLGIEVSPYIVKTVIMPGFIGRARLYPEARDVLEQLRQMDLLVAMVSSGHQRPVGPGEVPGTSAAGLAQLRPGCTGITLVRGRACPLSFDGRGPG